MKAWSIAICDQNQLFREGVRSLLSHSQFTVMHVASDVNEVFDAADAHGDVAVIVCGIEGAGTLPDELLARADEFKIVILANSPSARLLRQAAECGINAVLSKNISGEVLQRALEFVLLGQRLYPAPYLPYEPPDDEAEAPVAEIRSLADRRRETADPTVQLSEREAQILRCLVAGAPNKRIARDLGITEATVKVHIKGLLRKLRVNNRTQAAVWGLNNTYATEPRPILPRQVGFTTATLSLVS